MRKVFKAALIALLMLLAISIAVNAQGNVTNASATNPSYGGAYGNITQNANNVTSPPHAPGFEGIFVLTGLASAAYIASRRKR